MIKKIDSMIKSNKSVIITFLIALFTIGFIYNLNNVTPFGEKSLLCVDFYHQYGPMLGGLYNKITRFENVIYSFNIGLGIPFFRNFFNYLSSPFNIIMLLFTKKGLLSSYSFIIALKACFASTFFVYFLNKKFNTSTLKFVPLGILYGFSQYFKAYYWNIMWLDGMVLLPLITLGIENIVNNKSWKLYFISLAIMLFSNYFIGYMVCIFSVFYFILYLIYKTNLTKENYKLELKNVLKKIFTFALTSLLSGAIMAVFLLPMFKSMFTISATGGSIPTSQYYLFSLRDFLESHLTGVTTTVFASDTITSPNISAGILSIALLFIFLTNNKIKLKTKLIYTMLLGIWIFAFFNPVFDYIMHAFHVPNDLPYRYSFLYTFSLLIIGAYSINNIKESIFQINTIIYLLITTILIYLLMNSWDGITTNMLFINIILLTLYFILYIVYKFFKKSSPLVVFGLIVFAVVESIVSTNYNWNITQEKNVFYENETSMNNIKAYLKNYDTSFYRMEKVNMLTLNDGDWYDYNGVNTFSSMAYVSMAEFQNKLGIPGNGINSYYYQQTTPIYDLLFNVKYLIGSTNDKIRYTLLEESGEDIQEFKYTNGLIFGVRNEITSVSTDTSNPFLLQNEIMSKATGVNDILTESKLLKYEDIYDGDDGRILKFKYKNRYDNMYFYTNSSFIKFFIIGDTLYYLDENYSELAGNTERLNYSYVDEYNEERIINISSTEENLDVIVGYSHFYKDEFYIYDINQDLFESAYHYLNAYQFEMTKFKSNIIEGNITLDENMQIFTSIPYDEGWKVYIDGSEIDTENLFSSLLSFKGKKGKQHIKLIYSPPYQKLGLVITLGSIFVLIIRKKVIRMFKN